MPLLHYRKSLTPSRLWNGFRLLMGYWFSRWLRRPVLNALPSAIAIEPTTSCNLRCPECPSGLRSFSRPTGMMDPVFFQSIMDQIQGHVFHLTLYFQGEPYLHPKFLELVGMAKRAGLYVATSTNAHYLNEENAWNTVASKLDRLIISLDGLTQETYEKYRIGGRLNTVLEGAKNLLEARRQAQSATPYVVFQFLVVSHNEHEIENARQLANDMGVDEIVFKTAQVYDYEQGHPLIPQDDRFARYVRQANGTWKIKSSWENHCWKMWHSCVITWDGNVVPCCFDKDAQHTLGNLGEHSLKAIWKNDAYRNFRTALLKGRKEIDICRNCSEGLKVNFE